MLAGLGTVMAQKQLRHLPTSERQIYVDLRCHFIHASSRQCDAGATHAVVHSEQGLPAAGSLLGADQAQRKCPQGNWS